MNDQDELSQKMTAFVGLHKRILGEFGRSLSNSKRFLSLADRSLESEPEETESMLEQIKEIDLLGHLNNQYDEYRGVAGFLLPPNPPLDDEELFGEVMEIQTKYEALLEDAERQMELLDNLLSTLQTHH